MFKTPPGGVRTAAGQRRGRGRKGQDRRDRTPKGDDRTCQIGQQKRKKKNRVHSQTERRPDTPSGPRPIWGKGFRDQMSIENGCERSIQQAREGRKNLEKIRIFAPKEGGTVYRAAVARAGQDITCRTERLLRAAGQDNYGTIRASDELSGTYGPCFNHSRARLM